MKQFLLNILKVSSSVLATVLLLVLGTYLIITSDSFKKPYIIPNGKSIVIIGDSHTVYGIDDSIFYQSFNAARSGTAYIYSYVVLRNLIKENPGIEKVLLSFHGGSFVKSMDKWTTGDDYIREYLPSYFSLLDKEEILFFAKRKPFLSSIIRLPIKKVLNIINFIKKNDHTYKDLNIGGYERLDRNQLKKDIEFQKNQKNKEDEGHSQYQLEYLLKIAELCKIHGIELILINLPIYNSEIYGNKAALMEFYEDYLAGIKYVDLSDFPLPEDAYSDIDHVNYKGAEKLSAYLENNYKELF